MISRHVGLWAVLGFASLEAGVFPLATPVNRGAAGLYTPRNLALGEPRFTETRLYNVYDQGGSPVALLDGDSRLTASLGLLASGLSTPGDSLRITHSDYFLPDLAFFQPGVFALSLYYRNESESYRLRRGDSAETGKSRFGLDLAAGPASGIMRVGIGVHAGLGAIDYPGDPRRMRLEIPSLRLDLSSRVVPGLELGIYGGVAARFDSLENAGSLERVAELTLPRYGFLAGVREPAGFPLRGNTVLELAQGIFLGEYRAGSAPGRAYPTLETQSWDFQTQWMYRRALRDFTLGPALRFALRSEEVQGYAGIVGNESPFKKGAAIPGMAWRHDVADIGLGGNFAYREMASLRLEWETSGHTFDSSMVVEKRYYRFSSGVEHRLDKLPAMRIPAGWALALRAGWVWREEEKDRPGYREFQFDPFLPTVPVPTRRIGTFSRPGDPAAYSAFSLGFGVGLPGEKLALDALLAFPRRLERAGAGTQEASGLEFGVTARTAL